MANLGHYEADPNNVQGEYTLIEPGEYLVHISGSDMKPTKNGAGHYLELEIEILEGENAGRKLYDRLNLDNPNQQAVDIAQRVLNAICVAVGKLSITDSDELHNIPMIAVVKVDPAKPYTKDGIEREGSPQNSIKTYKPRDGATATPVASAVKSVAAKPAAAAEDKTPPWKKKAA